MKLAKFGLGLLLALLNVTCEDLTEGKAIVELFVDLMEGLIDKFYVRVFREQFNELSVGEVLLIDSRFNLLFFT